MSQPPNEQMQANNMVSHFDEDTVSLEEIVRPVWSNRYIVVAVTSVFVLAAVIFVSMLKPIYQATATLQIGSNQPSQTLSINDAFNEKSASVEQIRTQYELLKSRKFALRVIEELSLIEHPEFTGNKYRYLLSKSEEEMAVLPSLNAVIDGFRERLTITPIEKTELVHIGFKAYSPELAKLVADQVAQTYLEYQDELHSASKENTTLWLVDQLGELEDKLKLSEGKLQSFRESQKIVDSKGVLGLISDQLTELTSESLTIIKQREDMAFVNDFVTKHRGNDSKLLMLPEIANHQSYLQLDRLKNEKERRLSEVSKRYGPKHPTRISVEAELASVRERISSKLDELVVSFQYDYIQLVEQENLTDMRLQKAKNDFVRLTKLENEFSQLKREVETNKELYNTYLVRLKEADAMGEFKANFYVRIIDRAVAPKAPIKPKKALIVVVAAMAGFLLISIYVILKELLLDTLNTRRKVDSFSDAPVLAVLPKFKKHPKIDKGVAGMYADNRFTESIRTLRTSLLFRPGKKPPKIITVTSSVPNEGKSTIAFNLARSFAEMEKVLLIEADMRNPSLIAMLGLDEKRPGLSNLLAKTHELNECIHREPNLKLDVITSGIAPNNPLAFLSMKRFRMLLTAFSSFYDRIIIETPPVHAVSDALIISKLVDSLVYVVHGGKTKRDQITAGLRMLYQVNAPVEGIVINKSETLSATRYDNKYYNTPQNVVQLQVGKR